MHKVKKGMRLGICLAVIMMTTAGALYADGPVEKLARGTANIVESPVAYLNQYVRADQKRNFMTTIMETTLYGTFSMVGRLLVGVYEVVTFPVPLPADYEPLIQPATPIDEWRQMQS